MTTWQCLTQTNTICQLVVSGRKTGKEDLPSIICQVFDVSYNKGEP